LFFLLSYVFSSRKSEIREEQVLPGSEEEEAERVGKGGRREK
jgi:hypothetical protein